MFPILRTSGVLSAVQETEVGFENADTGYKGSPNSSCARSQLFSQQLSRRHCHHCHLVQTETGSEFKRPAQRHLARKQGKPDLYQTLGSKA